MPDPSTFADARAILQRYGIEPPEAVARCLAEAREETPKPGDPRLAQTRNVLIARPQQSLEAAAEIAGNAGYETVILGDALEGEARELGAEHAALALDRARGGRKTVFLSGGETTVTVKGDGRGGRNVEYLLGLALALDGARGIYAVACDTCLLYTSPSPRD